MYVIKKKNCISGQLQKLDCLHKSKCPVPLFKKGKSWSITLPSAPVSQGLVTTGLCLQNSRFAACCSTVKSYGLCWVKASVSILYLHEIEICISILYSYSIFIFCLYFLPLELRWTTSSICIPGEWGRMKKAERAGCLSKNGREPSYPQLFPPGLPSTLELAFCDVTYCSTFSKVCITVLKGSSIFTIYMYIYTHIHTHTYACVLSRISCVGLWNPVDCSPSGSSLRGFSRQQYWSGLPYPPPGDAPIPRIEPASLKSHALAGEFFTTSTTYMCIHICICLYVRRQFLWLWRLPSVRWRARKPGADREVGTSGVFSSPALKTWELGAWRAGED